jgi:hypothetical protein
LGSGNSRSIGTNDRFALASILAKHPEIWEVVGGGPKFGAEVALNPQPLPPRFAFLVSLAQTVISRAELIHEIAGATQHEGEQQDIIIVGGYTGHFVDDFTRFDFMFKFPFPIPKPNWFPDQLDGIDLIIMATQFEQAAKETFNPGLRQNFADASAKFVEASISRMQ